MLLALGDGGGELDDATLEVVAAAVVVLAVAADELVLIAVVTSVDGAAEDIASVVAVDVAILVGSTLVALVISVGTEERALADEMIEFAEETACVAAELAPIAAEEALSIETEAELSGTMGTGTCVGTLLAVDAREFATDAASEAAGVATEAAVLAALDAAVSAPEACVAAEPATLEATTASWEAAA